MSLLLLLAACLHGDHELLAMGSSPRASTVVALEGRLAALEVRLAACEHRQRREFVYANSLLDATSCGAVGCAVGDCPCPQGQCACPSAAPRSSRPAVPSRAAAPVLLPATTSESVTYYHEEGPVEWQVVSPVRGKAKIRRGLFGGARSCGPAGCP